MFSNNSKSLFDQKVERLNKLVAQKVCKSEGKYVVITNKEGFQGNYGDDYSAERHYFTDKRTALAYAQHYCEVYADFVGVFKMPQHICGFSFK